MDNPFRPVADESHYARIGITGPAGSGKSFTALTLATNLAAKVAAIDTERGRLKAYRHRFPNFDHYAPSTFDPRDLVRLLGIAAHHGYGAVVIDSASHYWMGPGGALEFVDAHEGDRGGKFSSGWKEYAQIERAMLDAIMGYPGHVICTLRVKTEYVVERQGDKTKVAKIGLTPVQRAGFEYEFDLILDMDRHHTATVTKSTLEALQDAEIERPGPELAAQIAEWCAKGTQMPNALDYRDRALDPAMTFDELGQLYREVKNRGLAGAAVVDDTGETTTLGQLIVRLGNERRIQEAKA